MKEGLMSFSKFQKAPTSKLLYPSSARMRNHWMLIKCKEGQEETIIDKGRLKEPLTGRGRSLNGYALFLKERTGQKERKGKFRVLHSTRKGEEGASIFRLCKRWERKSSGEGRKMQKQLSKKP